MISYNQNKYIECFRHSIKPQNITRLHAMANWSPWKVTTFAMEGNMTAKQIAAIKYLIGRAKVDSELAKRILWFLFDQSEGLTKDIFLTLSEKDSGYSADEISAAAHGVDRMISSAGQLHINEILAVAGINETDVMYFTLHYGHIENEELNSLGQFPGHKYRETKKIHPDTAPLRYTFWLARGWYKKDITRVAATSKVLQSINLRKPGLYEGLEKHE